MARALGIPARIAVGLTFVRGAFYYHAWPEVYLDEGGGRGYWLPVDPTLNQFPADATHLRLARGGLDRQAAILPLIGRMKMEVLDLELAPGSVPSSPGGVRPTWRRWQFRCRSAPSAAAGPARRAARLAPMIAVDDLVKRYGSLHRGRRRQPRRPAGRDPRLPRAERRRQDDDHPHDRRAAQADGGRILVNGHDLAAEPEAAKASLGFIPDRPFIYEKLTAGEFLRFHGGLYGMDGDGIDRARAEMLEMFELVALGARARRELLARHEAAAGHERRVPAPAARGARRRADGRPRSRAARGSSRPCSAG